MWPSLEYYSDPPDTIAADGCILQIHAEAEDASLSKLCATVGNKRFNIHIACCAHGFHPMVKSAIS
ncbi:predicted protein [Botrytis cinerea T4]|uniref:Uncharacterized protein n=1 Tax=Botryotinia fuckeliana (strain T4) TaxID=999810 RepID=G2YUI0_BOTF4|nr:predicted protein [Botrytis cinerea T4]